METILLFKKDLERYPTNFLRSMQLHLGLPNADRKDLIWLIAIHQANLARGKKRVKMPTDAHERLLAWARAVEAEDKVKDVLNGSSTKLILHSWELTKVPSEIGELANLKKLVLSDNQLKKIPIEIGDLENLEKLVLSRNKLKKLPSELGKLKNLKELFIGFNKLEELPVELGRLKNLQELSVRNNPLKEGTSATIPELQTAWRKHLLEQMGLYDEGQSIEELEQKYEQPLVKPARKM